MNVKPEHRTTTVVALCRSMREAQDYGACPILADALQEADFRDEAALAQLRGPLEHRQAERLVSLVYSEESAAAVGWLEQFVRDINYDEYDDYQFDPATGRETFTNRRQSDTDPHDYAYVIEQGYGGRDNGGMYFGSDAGADYFREGDENVREFYRNWSLATGQPVPRRLAGITFSCAC